MIQFVEQQKLSIVIGAGGLKLLNASHFYLLQITGHSEIKSTNIGADMRY